MLRLHDIAHGRKPPVFALHLLLKLQVLQIEAHLRAAPAAGRGTSPSGSIAGARPRMRSATIRPEPHAIVQPMWPCPVLKNRFSCRPAPRNGGPAGVIGRRHERYSPRLKSTASGNRSGQLPDVREV